MAINKADVKTALVAERRNLIELVGKLGDHDLDKPSLCKGWKVRDVLAHIIGFEMHHVDTLRLLSGKINLDDINNAQGKRYRNATKQLFIHQLQKGQRRVLFLLGLVPAPLFATKFIKIKNGWVSLAQLFGDLAADRAIHFVDIAQPLGLASQITNPTTLNVALDFMFSSLDMLAPKLPKAYQGKWICVDLTNPSRTIYWQIGAKNYTNSKPTVAIELNAKASANDFIFTITGRESLVKKEVQLEGNKELAKAFRQILNSNAFWN